MDPISGSESPEARPSGGKRSIPRIFIIAGPAATGKSTVAKAIASRYGLPMVEGDDLHSQENVEKMSQGQPLTDDDRWGWLQRICSASLETASPAQHPPEELEVSDLHPPGCITTCSALKKAYRDLLRHQLSVPGHAVLRFVFLTASEEELLQRIEERQDHYMKSNMVHSQIVTAEVPRTDNEDDGGDESPEEEFEPDCFVIWTDELNPDEVADRSTVVVGEMMVKDFEEESKLWHKERGGEEPGDMLEGEAAS